MTILKQIIKWIIYIISSPFLFILDIALLPIWILGVIMFYIINVYYWSNNRDYSFNPEIEDYLFGFTRKTLI